MRFGDLLEVHTAKSVETLARQKFWTRKLGNRRFSKYLYDLSFFRDHG